jgi:tRNA G46 methylase TrmB
MYLKKWKGNAENFHNQKCYAWMASRIQPFQPKRILDIGCGEGAGIIALAQSLMTTWILSLDDNKYCLDEAKNRCESNALNPELISRLDISAEEREHHISVIPKELHFASRITLVEGDFLWDKELLQFINALPKFDAITVWLLGTYDIKIECSNIAHLKAFTEIGKYRLLAHERIYQLADRILNPGGLVHFVDRGISTDMEKLKALSLAEHSDLSAETNLSLREYDVFDYRETYGVNRITMEKRFSVDSVVDGKESLALTSIISVKR